nr:post-GPI attachment to proteins factor 6-like isoform X1 [Neodiprion pinetum]
MEVQTLTCLLVIMVLAFLHISSSELEKIGQLPATTLVKFYTYRHVSIIYFKIPLDIALARWKPDRLSSGFILPKKASTEFYLSIHSSISTPSATTDTMSTHTIQNMFGHSLDGDSSITFDDVVRVMVSYDMDWSRRGTGRNYDSLNGSGAIIGSMSGFHANEVKTGGIFRCTPQNITVHIKPGSIPFVNPDKSKVPENLLEARFPHHSLFFTSDGTQQVQNITAPVPGDWFAIAFRSWSDPNDGKIEQQGISASCETILDAEVDVEREASLQLAVSARQPNIRLASIGDLSRVRFLMPNNVIESSITIFSSSGVSSEVEVNVTANSYISSKGTELAQTTLNSSTAVSVPFKVWTNAFHYLTVRLLSGSSTDVSVVLNNSVQRFSDATVVRLTRKSYPDFFLFDYEYLVDNQTKSSSVQLTTTSTSVFSFEINSISDTGGTLTVALRLKDKGKSEPENFTVFGCVHLGTLQDISPETGRCFSNIMESKLPVLVTSKTDPGPIYVHIPFPEPGLWYLSLRAFLRSMNCTCPETCQENSTMCPCLIPASGTVEMSVASSPCIEGNCGMHGRCIHYMNGGFVFSGCHCLRDYRGFDCTDDQYVQNDSSVLIDLLMLTLSNLVFVGSIYFALHRAYYAEALIYFAVMFFSTFYHACESGESVYNFCIMRVAVLQFCDFFTALLAFWVTLVAMVGLTPRSTAILDLGGAVVLATCAELNRTALWVFMTPTITGSCLVAFFWIKRCRARNTIHYPAKCYQYYYFPAGIGLVTLGLICYAFLQTQMNYGLVHSFWHMAVAGGVMLLLPNRKHLK